MRRKETVSGVELEIVERGNGRPLLFLHAGEGLMPERPWLDALSETYRVIAPFHPGFGGSALPDWFGTVDDLAYLYLDLADRLDLKDAVLVGASFGGWVAAEMMVRTGGRFSHLVLADPLGIKVRGRDDRDIADMHGMPRAQVMQLAWADPKAGEVDYTVLPETELAQIARGREALALFGWKPYMHNPRLKRWLHRIDRPTLLLWGDKDRIVDLAYAEGWSAEIPGAKLEVIKDAGHYPHWEQPQDFAKRIAAFAAPQR
jgi:pimeloyl-ACP methyl ester carboxylesterase